MENIIIIAILALICGLAARYVYKAKKSGRRCVGCPDGGCSCNHGGSGCGGSCGCGGHKHD